MGGAVPDAHVGTGDRRQLDGARETLVTLRVIVLKADLELDGLKKVTLLGVERVVEKLSNVRTHSGCGGVEMSVNCTLFNRGCSS